MQVHTHKVIQTTQLDTSWHEMWFALKCHVILFVSLSTCNKNKLQSSPKLLNYHHCLPEPIQYSYFIMHEFSKFIYEYIKILEAPWYCLFGKILFKVLIHYLYLLKGCICNQHSRFFHVCNEQIGMIKIIEKFHFYF